MSVSLFSYMTPAGRLGLPRYQYKGRDDSLYYKYIASPFAQYCVDTFTPRWLAPNAITLIGLSALIVSLALLVWHNPSFDDGTHEHAPWWLCILTMLSLFFYQTMDNMDGKQARRVGASSPLGLLFDHGCDAVNAGMIGSLAGSLVIGFNTHQVLLSWGGAMLLFFLNTWEEFHTGELILPIFNGPNEGLLMSMVFLFITAFQGQAFWQTPLPAIAAQIPFTTIATPSVQCLFGVDGACANKAVLADVLSLGILGMGIVTSIWHVYNIVATMYATPRPSPLADVGAAIARLIPMILVLAVATAWLLLGATSGAVEANRLVFFVTIGSLFSDLATRLMISHVSGQPFKPSYLALASAAIGPALALSARLFATPSVTDMSTPLYVAFATSTLVLATTFGASCLDIARTLDIDVFDISKQTARAAASKSAGAAPAALSPITAVAATEPRRKASPSAKGRSNSLPPLAKSTATTTTKKRTGRTGP